MAANSSRNFDPMPSTELLDEIAQSIANVDYAALGPDHRAVVFDLAVKAEQSAALHHVADWFQHSKLWDGI